MNLPCKFIIALAASAGLLIPLSTPSSAADNTAYGVGALKSGTTTGFYNDSAFGFDALYHDTTGADNTATGYGSLLHNNGYYNTADGYNALESNTTGVGNTAAGFGSLGRNNGSYNTATGFNSLLENTTGQGNTATGVNALYYNNGSYNTADGQGALLSNTTGIENVAVGVQTLSSNTTGTGNTANGYQALFNCTTDSQETATGYQALYSDTVLGFDGGPNENVADGYQALFSNTDGSGNLADGYLALHANTSGYENTAAGAFALQYNTNGIQNVAIGETALESSTSGNDNTAVGCGALPDNGSGGNNIGIGAFAGYNLDTGSNNIDIGSGGVNGEHDTIRIGVEGTQYQAFIAGIAGEIVNQSSYADVVIDATGRIGTVVSSRRFKQGIHDMGDASEALYSLRPVAFQYKHELDPKGTPQFGLIAEEVEKVNPALVARDSKGKVYSVHYEAVNAMLLNEFLKEHATVSKLEASIAAQEKRSADQRWINAQQQQEIATLTATLKEQASLLQKVSAQIEGMQSTPQVVSNNQ